VKTIVNGKEKLYVNINDSFKLMRMPKIINMESLTGFFFFKFCIFKRNYFYYYHVTKELSMKLMKI